jgi:hypothetical protein
MKLSQTTKKDESRRRGPEPERVKIEGMDWQEAVAKALRKRLQPQPKAPRKKRK